MRKRYGKTILMLAFMASLLFGMDSLAVAFAADDYIPEKVVTQPRLISVTYIPAEVEPEPEYSLTEDEINLIAQVTMAEVENQSEYCKRLVIDTILNRVDSLYFPDTVHGVIYAKNQFEVMVNGRFERCYVQEDIVKLVKDELINRTNTQVAFFNSIGFNTWSTPMFQEGCMYFSACQYE
jgi:N-acetylmuramoyl-L-alanine amidase